MSCIRRNVIRHSILAGFAALVLTAVATAQTAVPDTGLGQAWPNAADHSSSPYWHVYVFERVGIRYIQINDRNGTVHAAFGHAQDTIFPLPVGVDVDNVTITPSTEASASALPIYEDDAISVTPMPQSDGTTQITIQMTGCEPSGCMGGRTMIQ